MTNTEYKEISDGGELFSFLKSVVVAARPVFDKMGVKMGAAEEYVGDAYIAYRYLLTKYSPDKNIPIRGYMAKYIKQKLYQNLCRGHYKPVNAEWGDLPEGVEDINLHSMLHIDRNAKDIADAYHKWEEIHEDGRNPTFYKNKIINLLA